MTLLISIAAVAAWSTLATAAAIARDDYRRIPTRAL